MGFLIVLALLMVTHGAARYDLTKKVEEVSVGSWLKTATYFWLGCLVVTARLIHLSIASKTKIQKIVAESKESK